MNQPTLNEIELPKILRKILDNKNNLTNDDYDLLKNLSTKFLSEEMMIARSKVSDYLDEIEEGVECMLADYGDYRENGMDDEEARFSTDLDYKDAVKKLRSFL
jgi:hypothetical protein